MRERERERNDRHTLGSVGCYWERGRERESVCVCERTGILWGALGVAGAAADLFVTFVCP